MAAKTPAEMPDDMSDDFFDPEHGGSPAGTAGPLAYTIPDEAAGKRLDKALAAGLPDLSRSRVQALL